MTEISTQKSQQFYTDFLITFQEIHAAKNQMTVVLNNIKNNYQSLRDFDRELKALNALQTFYENQFTNLKKTVGAMKASLAEPAEPIHSLSDTRVHNEY